METLFPFGLPSATRFYCALYVASLMVHVIFMNYTFAGAGYLAVVGLSPGSGPTPRYSGPLARVLRDWMPFALGATITAGVAPLLFLQILYRDQFYTANLLLFHRWMAILPVLIAGFYLLYLQKSRTAGSWPAWMRAAVSVGSFVCIAFTGYSWSENHLLSLDESVWPSFYGDQRSLYWHPSLVPRVAMWLIGAVPTMILLTSGQLWWSGQHGREVLEHEPRRLAALAMGGLIISVGCGLLYYTLSDETVQQTFTTRLAGPYLILAMVGAAIQLAVWSWQMTRTHWSGRCLLLAGCGAVATILGMSVVREALRLSRVDLADLSARHAHAAGKGGLGVFVAFLALNLLLIGWCIVTVRQHLRPETRSPKRLR